MNEYIALACCSVVEVIGFLIVPCAGLIANPCNICLLSRVLNVKIEFSVLVSKRKFIVINSLYYDILDVTVNLANFAKKIFSSRKFLRTAENMSINLEYRSAVFRTVFPVFLLYLQNISLYNIRCHV